MDVFFDDYFSLAEEDSTFGSKSDNILKVRELLSHTSRFILQFEQCWLRVVSNNDDKSSYSRQLMHDHTYYPCRSILCCLQDIKHFSSLKLITQTLKWRRFNVETTLPQTTPDVGYWRYFHDDGTTLVQRENSVDWSTLIQCCKTTLVYNIDWSTLKSRWYDVDITLSTSRLFATKIQRWSNVVCLLRTLILLDSPIDRQTVISLTNQNACSNYSIPYSPKESNFRN